MGNRFMFQLVSDNNSLYHLGVFGFFLIFGGFTNFTLHNLSFFFF